MGPGYNPLVPKIEGFQVETVDYTDVAGLRTKYRNNPHVDINRIEEVDHIVDGDNDILSTIGEQKKFDYIVASHVIEHTPDLLRFLKNCENLLLPGGTLLLAVPDKRHCFDVFLPLTSTGMILQAHLDVRLRPTPGAIFDDVAYNAVRGGAIGWSNSETTELRFFAPFEDAQKAYTAAKKSDNYLDVHVWRFVPSSFRLILHDLHALGEIRLREDRFFDSVGNEFYITLSTASFGCPVDRLTLAAQALVEQSQILVSV